MREACTAGEAFGAGLMCFLTELQFAVGKPRTPMTTTFDLETVMRTTYEIDKFQRAYSCCRPSTRFATA